MSKYTILIPCLNEERTIGMCIADVRMKAHLLDLDYEILVIDNGSTDASADIARKYDARVVYEGKRGYGNAIKRGIIESQGDYVIMLDADCSYKLDQLIFFVSALENGYSFVIGNRFTGKIRKGAMPLSHKIGVPLLSFLANKHFKTDIGDYHCGLRAFNKNIYNGVHFKSDGMEFATEMIAKAKNYKMCEIPITLYKDKRNKKSHLNTISDGFRHLRYILCED